jgi:hypothetical protein
MAYVKDPGEVKDYAIDWAAHLGTSETISTSAWVVATGLTSTAFPDTKTDTTTTIWLSGGTAGVPYLVTNHVVTNQGREFERSFTVMVQDL